MVVSADRLGVRFNGGPVVRDVTFALGEGESGLIAGGPGSGKTTLGLAVCGCLPLVSGAWRVDGGVTMYDRPVAQGELPPDVSILLENPYTQLSGMKRSVREELAFPLECRGVSPSDMAPRIEAAARAFGIEPLLDRNVHTLSGGELQRILAAAALITRPRFLFLDRPLTEIDDAFRPEFLALVRNHLAGTNGAALIAEEPWLVDAADVQHTIDLGGTTDIAPKTDVIPGPVTGGTLLDVVNLTFSYDDRPLIRDCSFRLEEGGVMFVEGPNGSGKTTLARLICGLLSPRGGRILIGGCNAADLPEWERLSAVGYALQNAGLQLCRRTVRDELTLAAQWGHPADDLADMLGLTGRYDRHPLELTRAEQKRLGIALACGKGRHLAILDEPSQYQDHEGFNMIVDVVLACMERGMGVLVITHDPRFGRAFPGVPAIRPARADSA